MSPPRGLRRLAGGLSRPSPSAIGALALSLSVCVALVLHPPPPASVLAGVQAAQAAFRVAAIAMAGLAIAMLATSRERLFRSFMAAHAGISFTLVLLYSLPREAVTLLLICNVLLLSLFQRFPLSFVLNVTYSLLFLLLYSFRSSLPLLSIVELSITAAAVATLGSFMGRYREGYVAQQRYIGRLEDNVSTLTRANFLSQNYARDVEAESRIRERQRLTRDIHDMVGYTLTNSIMMFEAVKVMVKNDPGRVAEYAETARRNVEEGLAQIKSTLRDLRSQEHATESVTWAIKKLVTVFRMSTGVDVRFEFGNVAGGDLDRFRDVIYHFIQEGLINAFRHGRAERIVVLFWDYGDDLRVSLDDNGVGCPEPPRPGIGISGMRERASSAGGSVEIDRTRGGFRISLHLPKGARRGQEDPSPDRGRPDSLRGGTPLRVPGHVDRH